MTIKEIKARIKGIKSIKKITKAMQMVSASKLRYILERLEISNRYSNLVNSLYQTKQSTLESTKEDIKSLLVLVSADRGLCGSHSTGVLKHYHALSNQVKSNSKLIIIGSKANDSLKKTVNKAIALKFLNVFKKSFSFFELINLGNRLNKLISSEEFNELSICYNRYISSVSNEISTKNITLNSELDIELDVVHQKDGLHNFKVFYIISSLYAILCNSKASEESIRMVSMDNATSSADELLQNLTRIYNMSRQASITTELIEIISGAESLKQGKN